MTNVTREQFAVESATLADQAWAGERLAGWLAGKSVVVFGAGYIGARLVARACAQKGTRVAALTRNEERAAELQKLGAQVIRADLASPEWHGRAELSGAFDCVINCVSGGASAGGIDGYRRSYLEGIKSIVAWARRTRQRGPLVYTSSTSVYPQGGGARVAEDAATAMGEDAMAGAGAGTDVAGAVLLETEKTALTDWPGERGACVLRLAGIYGPERHHLLGQLRVSADTGSELSGCAEDHLNLIYRDDVCDAIWAALLADKAKGAVFNIADNAPPTRAELCGWLAVRLGLPMPRFSGQPAPGRRRRTPDRVIVNERARCELGWQPRHPTFREGYEAIFAETEGGAGSQSR